MFGLIPRTAPTRKHGICLGECQVATRKIGKIDETSKASRGARIVSGIDETGRPAVGVELAAEQDAGSRVVRLQARSDLQKDFHEVRLEV